MTAFVSMLRGVNVGGHNKIKMEALRSLYESLGLTDAQTHIQSGNVIFKSKARDPIPLAKRIGDAIEREFGFRPTVVLRTPAELREAIAINPFAGRKGIDPSKLLVTFLAGEPEAQGTAAVRKLKLHPEELFIQGREIYVYFPDGMARPKFSWPAVEKLLKVSGTGRNWNTVTKLLELAEKLEAG